MKKNKKILGDLKSDNKKLRSDLSNLMSDQGKNTNSSEVSKLEKQAADLRRQYDDTTHKLAMRQKQVAKAPGPRSLPHARARADGAIATRMRVQQATPARAGPVSAHAG